MREKPYIIINHRQGSNKDITVQPNIISYFTVPLNIRQSSNADMISNFGIFTYIDLMSGLKIIANI